MEQAQIQQQLCLASNTGVDWDCFCREVCEIVLIKESCKLGGPEKTVQIDESKIGKELKKDRGGVSLFQWRRGQELNSCR